MFWNEEARAPRWECVRLQCFGICTGEYDQIGSEKEVKKAIKSLFRSHLSIKAQNRVARPSDVMYQHHIRDADCGPLGDSADEGAHCRV